MEVEIKILEFTTTSYYNSSNMFSCGLLSSLTNHKYNRKIKYINYKKPQHKNTTYSITNDKKKHNVAL